MPAGGSPARAAADLMRQGKGHLPWGQAKLEEADGESTYKEYFWAKDLIRYVEANPGKLDFALPRGKAATGAHGAENWPACFASNVRELHCFILVYCCCVCCGWGCCSCLCRQKVMQPTTCLDALVLHTAGRGCLR